jgi:hypothetical protein
LPPERVAAKDNGEVEGGTGCELIVRQRHGDRTVSAKAIR